jgi:phosphatidylserine synthase 2
MLQIVLDVLICNGIGIYLGHLVLKYLELKEYDWGGRTNAGKKRQRSVSNAKRMVLQFTPYSWTKFNWSILESPKRFFAVIGFIALVSQKKVLSCHALAITFFSILGKHN